MVSHMASTVRKHREMMDVTMFTWNSMTQKVEAGRSLSLRQHAL